jgi:hypothetical protein
MLGTDAQRISAKTLLIPRQIWTGQTGTHRHVDALDAGLPDNDGAYAVSDELSVAIAKVDP